MVSVAWSLSGEILGAGSLGWDLSGGIFLWDDQLLVNQCGRPPKLGFLEGK